MGRWTRSLSAELLAVVTFAAWAGTAGASPMYNIVDLGTLPGTTQSIATGINASGQVVGVSYSSSDGTYTPNTALQYLNISYDAGAKSFLYSGGQTTQISPTGGPVNAINNDGQVVGGNDSSLNNAGQYVGGAPNRLVVGGTPTILSGFVPLVINDQTLLGGATYSPSGGYTHAALYQEGHVTDLSNSLMLKGAGDVVLALNNAGNAIIAEGLMGGANPVHYMLYSAATGHATDLTTLAGGSGLAALALNNKDQIVGTGFLYSDGQFTSLQSLLPSTSHWSNLNATGINDSGQIVGQGLIDGQEHAFLMSPQSVPEPTTLTVLALGFGAASARCYWSHAGARATELRS